MQQEFFKVPSWQLLLHFIQVQLTRPFGTDLRIWEWLSLLPCMLAAWMVPARSLETLRLRFHQYAQHRWRAVWTCALLPVVARVALLPVAPVPQPSVHDEFSWLLMADTFQSGRLTNPTHPLWQHFETIHEIQRPTYNSMYPPGFGALIAVGYLLHNPWIGVLLSVTLMCGATCWALQAWLPPAWAFGGALVVAVRLCIGSYWMNGYVGGAPLPFMAGALLLGATARFLRKPGVGLALAEAAAIVILVNTRPFEGTALSTCCMLYIIWNLRTAPACAAIGWRTVAPAGLVLAAGGAFTLYYNWRVTDDPLKIPYVVNRETYGWPENLAIPPPPQVVFRHKILKDMYETERAFRIWYSTFGRMLASWCARAASLWEFFIGPALTLPLLFVPAMLGNRKFRWPFYLLVAMAALNTLQLMAYPQHVATEAIIFYVFVAAGLRQIYVRAQRLGVRPERVMAGIALSLLCGAWLLLNLDSLHPKHRIVWEWPHLQFGEVRAAMVSKLEAMPGKHLVVVRYAPTHNPHEQWVYNRADIDGSKIVWANSMGAKEDRDLLSYFHDRQAWLFEPDTDESGFLPLTPRTYGKDQGSEQIVSEAYR